MEGKANSVFISSREGALPLTFTTPSTTSAGVLITPKVMIFRKSVTFSIS